MGNHVIHTQLLEADFKNKSAALEGQKTLQERYYQDLMPMLEQVLDEYDPVNRSLRIDKLELDLGRMPASLPKDLMRQRLRDALEDQLRKLYVEKGFNFSPGSKSLLNKKNNKSQTAKTASEWELFEYFLNYGRFPWWASKSPSLGVSELIKSIFENQKSMLLSWLEKRILTCSMAERLVANLTEKHFEEILKSHSTVQQSFQFTKDLEFILQHLIPSGKVEKSTLHFRLKTLFLLSFFGKRNELSNSLEEGLNLLFKQDLKTADQAASFIYELAMLLYQNRIEPAEKLSSRITKSEALNKNSKLSQLTQSNLFWKRIFVELELLKDQKKEFSTSQELLDKWNKSKKREESDLLAKAPEIDETIIIENAGLVLTAAFLPRFFENLGLTKAGNFISEQAQQKAVFLLQAMLLSDEAFDESDLTLNKLLCGLLPSSALGRPQKISNEERTEIDLLLESMATQWTALKSTSGKMVAEGFFQREGSVRRAPRGYQLQIQRLPFDLLLDRLPWTIGMIKLPWMEDILTVEW